jgi:hypothetical protein
MELLIVIFPLVIFLVGAYSVPKKSFEHPDDFYIAYKKVGSVPFSSSSIAYAFQVSTIYPFLLWSASNLVFVPAVNSICWGVGILLFYLSYSKIKPFIGTDQTLHGFLGSTYGPSVRMMASVLTIVGFTGYVIAETYFGSRILLSLVSDENIFYFLVFFVILYVFSYVSYGGQLSSIRTDQLQLIISYIGIFGLMIYFFYLLVIHHSVISATLFFGLIILLIFPPTILALRRLRFIQFSPEPSVLNSIINRTLNVLITIFFVALFALAIAKFASSKIELDFTGILTLKGFGISGLIALTILPLSWQFVDMTNWQRLLSVKPPAEQPDSLDKEIKRGLRVYAIESPFTWLIFLFFGMLASTTISGLNAQDLLIDIPKSLISSSSYLERFLGYSFIISILSVMISTVDSFIVGIIFTFVYDTYKPTRVLIDSRNLEDIKRNYTKIISAGNIFGILITTLGIALFVWFAKNIPSGGDFFINLLLTFYTAQLSFFPLIFGVLFIKKIPSTSWAMTSLISGAVIGISSGIYTIFFNQEYVWFPIILSFVTSGIAFSIGILSSSNVK